MQVAARTRRHYKAWNVRIVSLLTGLMGVINVVSAVTPSLADRMRLLRQILPLQVRYGGRLTAVLAGFALLLLARALWRRKRVAWLLTLVVLAVSVVSQMLKGLNYEEAALAAALALWLLFLRPHFHARSDPPSLWQGMRTLAAALLFTLAYGVAGFYLLDRHFSVHFGLAAALKQTVIMFAQFYDPGLQPVTRLGRYFADSIYTVSAATLGYALLMLFRPVLVRRLASAVERAEAKAIVQAHGRSALARFTLFDDKSYYFTPGGSVLAYVVKGRIALVLADPIGPVGDAAAAIAGFQGYCARNDWQPAFYQTQPDYLEAYRRAGLMAVCIGHEAVVDVASFSLAGRTNKGLRSAVTKLARLDYQAKLDDPPLPDRFLRELRAVSDEWLTTIRGAEMRFSLGGFHDDYIRNSPVMAVRAPGGFVSAFANVVPEYQRNEITVDLIRHRREVENGTMDFLFAHLIEWAKAHGYTTFNLGLSALAGVGQDADDPAVEKALHYIYEHIYHFYNFKGLHAFKAKFQPGWSPRYLIYPGPASLPAVAIALIRADSGNDFLKDYFLDFLEGWLRRRSGARAPVPAQVPAHHLAGGQAGTCPPSGRRAGERANPEAQPAAKGADQAEVN
jgi:phosphatidylglycerol lysyltransferase